MAWLRDDLHSGEARLGRPRVTSKAAWEPLGAPWAEGPPVRLTCQTGWPSPVLTFPQLCDRGNVTSPFRASVSFVERWDDYSTC